MKQKSQFKPATFLAHQHLQTLFPSLRRKLPNIFTHKERLELDDGDFLDLLWSHPYEPSSNKPIVFLFHGLTGSYRSSYIQGMLRAIEFKGWCGVLMHFRGCSDTPNRLPRAYHSGETGDAKHLIQTMHKRFPEARLFASGYSLGGNMLLKLQGEWGQDSLLSGASSTCAPLNLATCADVMTQGFSRFYQWIIMRDLRKALHEKYLLMTMPKSLACDAQKIKTLKTFWDYDDCYTAPIHGFKDADDYYTKCSSDQYLKAIATPTLVIQALDDPFMNASVIPGEEGISDSVTLEVSEYGGHVGFVSGSFFRPKYWLEARILGFFDGIYNDLDC